MSTPRVCLCPTSSCPWPPWGLACPAQEEERVPRTEAPAICARKRALLSPGRLEKQVWAPGGTARAAGKGCARGMPEHGSLKLGTWQDPRSPGSCHRDREEVKRHSETGCLSPWAMFKVSPARCPRHASHISQRRYAPGYGWYVLPPPPPPPTAFASTCHQESYSGCSHFLEFDVFPCYKVRCPLTGAAGRGCCTH